MPRPTVCSQQRYGEILPKNCQDAVCCMFLEIGSQVRYELVMKYTYAKAIDVGNSPIRGHPRRGSKKLKQAMESVQRDRVVVVDEYLSSSVCPYCFRRLATHMYRRGEQRKKCNGAKICCNPTCPSRPLRCSTMSRDGVGSHNIALIGVSQLIANDGKVLPPFRRETTPTNQPKEYLVTNYSTALDPTGKLYFPVNITHSNTHNYRFSSVKPRLANGLGKSHLSFFYADFSLSPDMCF